MAKLAGDSVIKSALENLAALLKRSAIVSMDLLVSAQEVHIALARDIEAVPVGAAERRAGELQRLMADGAGEQGVRLLESFELPRVHMSLLYGWFQPIVA